MTDFVEDREFSRLFAALSESEERAPAAVKARLYTALVAEQQSSGPLASLDASVSAGRGICVFERLVQITPLNEKAKSPFFCRTCHARILAEHLDHPPIFWPHCPYSGFKKS